jgi:hypothetical protein
MSWGSTRRRRAGFGGPPKPFSLPLQAGTSKHPASRRMRHACRVRSPPLNRTEQQLVPAFPKFLFASTGPVGLCFGGQAHHDIESRHQLTHA